MKTQPIVGITLIALGTVGISLLEGGLARRTDFASNGEQIYYTGVSSRSGPIPFLGGPMWLRMHGGGCAACHSSAGRGGVPVMMGTTVPPDIRYARLTEVHRGEPQEPAHSAYTDALIKRALTEGADPSGRELDWTMPRWRLSDTISAICWRISRPGGKEDPMMPMGWGPCGGWGWGWGLVGGFFMLAFWLLILVGIVLLVRWIWEQSGSRERSGASDSAQDILRARYARGEINKEQFEQMKANLR